MSSNLISNLMSRPDNGASETMTRGGGDGVAPVAQLNRWLMLCITALHWLLPGDGYWLLLSLYLPSSESHQEEERLETVPDLRL